jgi:(p)ppGpp synthase/HD superfamily hydrolase
MSISTQFDQALHYATLIYAGQKRKGTDIPYLAHILGVVSIALEHGATETEAIGALLHDAGEDAGGEGRIADIRRRFGNAVAEIVEGCTDTVENPKPAWRARKQKYIDHVASASPSVILVSAADKLHNARAILSDYREIGEQIWLRFNGGKDGTLWYYRELLSAFRLSGDTPLLRELAAVVTQLEVMAGEA